MRNWILLLMIAPVHAIGSAEPSLVLDLTRGPVFIDGRLAAPPAEVSPGSTVQVPPGSSARFAFGEDDRLVLSARSSGASEASILFGADPGGAPGTPRVTLLGGDLGYDRGLRSTSRPELVVHAGRVTVHRGPGRGCVRADTEGFRFGTERGSMSLIAAGWDPQPTVPAGKTLLVARTASWGEFDWGAGSPLPALLDPATRPTTTATSPQPGSSHGLTDVTGAGWPGLLVIALLAVLTGVLTGRVSAVIFALLLCAQFHWSAMHIWIAARSTFLPVGSLLAGVLVATTVPPRGMATATGVRRWLDRLATLGGAASLLLVLGALPLPIGEGAEWQWRGVLSSCRWIYHWPADFWGLPVTYVSRIPVLCELATFALAFGSTLALASWTRDPTLCAHCAGARATRPQRFYLYLRELSVLRAALETERIEPILDAIEAHALTRPPAPNYPLHISVVERACEPCGISSVQVVLQTLEASTEERTIEVRGEQALRRLGSLGKRSSGMRPAERPTVKMRA